MHLAGIHTFNMSGCGQITDAMFVHLSGIRRGRSRKRLLNNVDGLHKLASEHNLCVKHHHHETDNHESPCSRVSGDTDSQDDNELEHLGKPQGNGTPCQIVDEGERAAGVENDLSVHVPGEHTHTHTHTHTHQTKCEQVPAHEATTNTNKD